MTMRPHVLQQTEEHKLGAQIFQLLRRPDRRKWLDRRFERFTPINERTVSREVTFYINFDSKKDEEIPKIAHETYVVPLHRMTRYASVAAKVTHDELGEFSRPTTLYERKVVAAGLQARWWEDHHVVASFQTILECISAPRQSVPLMNHVSPGYVDEGRKAILDLLDSLGELPPESYRKIRRDLYRWQGQYLLLVELPTRCFNDNRTIIRLSYLQSTEAPFALTGSLRRVQNLIVKFIAGTASLWFRLTVNGIGDSESSHFSIQAPEGFRTVGASVRVNYLPDDKSDGSVVWNRDNDQLPDEAHISVDTEGRAIESATLFVSFYPYKTGLLIQSVISSWILFFILDVFHRQVANAHYVWSHYNLDSSVSASLILLIPAVVVTIVTQRDINRIASKCFALTKFFLALTAAATIAASALLAIKSSPSVQRLGWSVCYWTSLAVAVRLAVGASLHWWRSGSFRTWIDRIRVFLKHERQARPGGLAVGAADEAKGLKVVIRKMRASAWKRFPKLETVEAPIFVDDAKISEDFTILAKALELRASR